ncbi:MAG: universal stress protein [Rhodospirillaceae bacterium]|nr:universal stress protein [Rhodospirillaceae bacterium]
MFKNIVVGTDGSERAGIAVSHATQLAAWAGGTLHIVAAISPTAEPTVAAAVFGVASGGAEDNAAVEEEFREIVAQAAAGARQHGIDVGTHIAIGSAADVLCDVAAKVKADLIVVGNRGMQGALKFLGSVPNSVSHSAPCSVLIVDTRAAK